MNFDNLNKKLAAKNRIKQNYEQRRRNIVFKIFNRFDKLPVMEEYFWINDIKDAATLFGVEFPTYVHVNTCNITNEMQIISNIRINLGDSFITLASLSTEQLERFYDNIDIFFKRLEESL